MNWDQLLANANYSHLFSDLKITDIVTASFTVVLAVATIQLARATNVLANDTKRNSRQREISNSIEASTEVANKLRVLTHGKYDDRQLIEALNAAEYLAISVRNGNLDGEVVFPWIGVDLIRAHEALAPEISRLRSDMGSSTLYSEFERLARAFKQRISPETPPCRIL